MKVERPYDGVAVLREALESWYRGRFEVGSSRPSARNEVCMQDI